MSTLVEIYRIKKYFVVETDLISYFQINYVVNFFNKLVNV